MRVFVSFPDADDLPLYSETGAVLEYSPDFILDYIKKLLAFFGGFEAKLYSQHSLDKISDNNQLVFDVEIEDSFRPTALKSRENGKAIWRKDFITRIHAAKYGDKLYDLAETWQQQKKFEQRESRLRSQMDHLMRNQDHKNLGGQIGNFLSELKALEGIKPYAELLRILQITSELIKQPTADKLDHYQQLIQELKDANSPWRSLSIAMIGLGAAIAALGIGCTTFFSLAILGAPVGIALTLAGLGLFAGTKPKISLSTAMQNLLKNIPLEKPPTTSCLVEQPGPVN